MEKDKHMSRRDFFKAALGIGFATGLGGGIGAGIGVNHGPDILEWGNNEIIKIQEGEPAIGLRLITHQEAVEYMKKLAPSFLKPFQNWLPTFDVHNFAYQQVATDSFMTTDENLYLRAIRTYNNNKQVVYQLTSGERHANFAKTDFWQEDENGDLRCVKLPALVWPDGAPINHGSERSIEWFNTLETLHSAGYTDINLFLRCLIDSQGYIRRISNAALVNGPETNAWIAGGVFVRATNPNGQGEYLLQGDENQEDGYTRTGTNYTELNRQYKFVIPYTDKQ